MKNIVIACGGTGGHLTPGIALAQSLEELGCPTWLLISQKNVDSRLASKYPDLSFIPMPGAPLIRTPLGLLKFLKGFLHSFFRSRAFFRKISADALIGFGGFSTFGPALAARTCGIPFHVHEANRIIGKAVRFLANRANRVYLPLGINLPGIPADKVSHIGYPLRADFRRVPMERARKCLGISMKEKLLLVLGGSQGAVSLNQWVKNNLAELAIDGISVYCLTGLKNQSSGTVQLEGIGGETITSRFVSFTDQMHILLSAANLVISRAGAGSIAEIVRCRVPSILIPYPYAADNHQHANANYLEAKGGGVVCPEERMNDKLLLEVREVMFNEEFRAMLRRNLYSLDHEDVSSVLAKSLLKNLRIQKSSQMSSNLLEASL
jgi:UDP-N-acetylglucosamine--N-acetylmuramyl-(pentapeptide) pyrophosphoryl-undecaprenol N-acetylglucosamine transferase